MKIGLLTFHDTTNFGSWLQTYGLYKKIQQLGYDVEIINYKCEGIEYREKLNSERICTLPIEDICVQFRKQIVFKYYLYRYMKLSRKYTKSTIQKVNGKYNLFLLGSDLVWDLNITYGDTTYLFDFLNEHEPRCAYAASSGRDYILESQRKLFCKNLKSFKYITVRESGMQTDIEDLYKHIVPWVCDPTLLLKQDEWKKFLNNKKRKEKYVLLYFIDGKGNLSRLAKKYARIHGYKLIAINKDFNIRRENMVAPISVRDFLTLIYYSEKIFTASYHGMLFSLIFNKQFAFYPFEPSTRMLSVAKMLGIQDQNITSNYFNPEVEIDYEIVNQKLDEFRNDSLNYLKKMLDYAL